MNINLEEFKTELQLRIDWSELNLYGHVSNLEFFKYIQASRIHYLEDIGLGDSSFKETGTGTILASTTCQFKQQLYYPGEVRILSKIDFMRNTSFGITHVILNEANEIAGFGQDIIVLFDYNTNIKLSIPADIRNRIQKKEGKIFDMV